MSLRLITIPISHYCDKARWALEHSGHAYVEEAHLQIFHYWATRRRGAGAYVPVLVRDGGLVEGSERIARWADAHRRRDAPSLYPAAYREEIMAFEDELDGGFGVPGRLIMYHHALQHADELVDYLLTGVPTYQRWLAPHVLGVAGTFIRRRLDVHQHSAELARATCLRVLDEVAERLGGRRFLFGDSFSAADLAFAALSAPLTLPREYGVPLPDVHELGGDYGELVREARGHPAGAFALRLYCQHRQRRPAGGQRRPAGAA